MTKPDEPAAPTGRGGPGRGQGRKPAAPGEKMVVVSLRFTVPQREKLTRLGGVGWIRTKIDKSIPGKAPAAPEETRQRDAQPDQVLHVMPMRMTEAQKAKLGELGGGAWLRDRIDLAREPK